MIFLRTIPGALSLGLIWGVMALGLYVSYKILDFADLTVDGSICTGAVVCAVLINAGFNFALATLIAVIAGAVCGLLTGAFHTGLGIPPILSGILSQLALWSVNLKILGKAHESLNGDETFLIVTQLNQAQTIPVMLGVVLLLIGAMYWFFGTQLGCSIRATGCNEQMARAQGINTKATKVIGLAISNGIVALSGALMSQYLSSADINMGRGAIVIGLAAVIIGLAIVSRLPNNFALQLVGVVLGAIVYFLIYQFIVNLGFDTDLLKLLSALLVALFLAIPYWKSKLPKKNKKAAKVPQSGAVLSDGTATADTVSEQGGINDEKE